MAALATEGGNISVAIAWKTDELSNSEVRYATNSAPWDQYTNTLVDDDLVKKHTVILTGLREGQRYYFRAASTDALGNGPSSAPSETNNPFREQSFRIEKPSDNEAPRIVDGPHLKAIDKNSAVIVWETDEPASSMLQYGLSKAEWGGFDHSKVNTDMRTDHSVTITGLSATTQYFFMVGAMDATGNGPGKNENPSNPSLVDSFWTTGIGDETPPDISGIEVVYATDATALIQWETDEPGNSMVQYDLSSRTWDQYEYSSNDSEVVTSHRLTLTNLKPDTTYYFRISSTDTSGNGPGTDSDLSNPSEELTFQTAAEPDVNAPQISEVKIVMGDDGQSVVVEWVTDEPGNSQVAYGPTSGEWDSYASYENNPELTREHSVTLTNLETDILYYIRVSSMDASGNNLETLENDANPSQELTFQLGSGMVGNDIAAQEVYSLSHSASEVSCFINAMFP
jgi:phosphodiesterase/alkaline phosphatase D-like protein